MENLYILLEERLQYIKSFVKYSTEFFNNISNIVRGFDINSYNKFTNLSSISNTHIENIKKSLSANKSIENIINIYDIFSEFEYDMSFILSVINNSTYTEMLVYSMSQTFISNIYLQKDNINNIYKIYVKSYTRDLDIFKDVNELNDIENNNSIIYSGKYKSGNRLITYLISVCLEKSNETNKKKLQQYIENMKDNILGTSNIKSSKNTNNDVIMQLIIRYNLIPVSNSMKLKDLFVLFNDILGYDINSIEDLTKKYTIVIINKIYKMPVEFNILPLIDIKYVLNNNLFTKETSGITDKVIKRYSNVIRRDFISLITQNNNSIEFYDTSSITSDRAIIIETLDGENYRILSNKLDVYTVSKDVVDKIKNGVPTRPEKYNDITSNDILEKCFDEQLINIYSDYENAKRHIPDMEYLKKTIVNKMLLEFNKIAIPENNNEYKKIVLNRNITSNILGTILYSNYNVDRESPENSTSFLKIVHKIIGEFYKELSTIFNNKPIPDRIYKEKTKDNIKEYLKGHYKELIENTFDILDIFPSKWREIEFSLKEFILERKIKIL